MSQNEEKSKIKLDKTTAEQEMVRSIEALENSLKGAEGPESKKVLMEQIKVLKDQLLMLIGPNYTELKEENIALQKEIEALKKNLDNTGTQCKINFSDDLKEDLYLEHSQALRHRFYRLLLRKYSSTINEHEKKTVGELKALVNKDDLTVQSLANQFMKEDYDFGKDYLGSAKELVDYLKAIEYVSLDPDLKLNFWLTPKEILNEKISDDEDFAVFLCSLLYAFGDNEAEVVVAELDNLNTHAIVVTKYKGKFFLFDPCQKKDFDFFSGSKESILESYSFEGAKIRRFIYKFNNSNYEQFVE